MFKKSMFATTVAAGGLVASVALIAVPALADEFVLRIGSGHPAAPVTSVNQANVTFVPRMTERVAKETNHTVRFIEGYAGTIAKTDGTLEATQLGVLDIGLYCTCFEPTKAFFHNINYFMPFVSGDPYVMGPATREIKRKYDFFFDQIAKFKQRLMYSGAWDDYGLGTKFEWSKMSDLKGIKIGAAGPNLPWLDYAGATKVATNAPEVYNALQSGVFEGVVIFPAVYYGFKWGEIGKYYTTMGWGSVNAYPMTVNHSTWNKLPDEIKGIWEEEMEVYFKAVEDEGTAKFTSSLQKLREQGVTVKDLDPAVRLTMAKAIEPWVNQKAQEFEDLGVPGKAVFRDMLATAIRHGAKPVHHYTIK
jgi:TRAP-type C4-dicarboxylate transport system substrate-binding protein